MLQQGLIEISLIGIGNELHSNLESLHRILPSCKLPAGKLYSHHYGCIFTTGASRVNLPHPHAKIVVLLQSLLPLIQ
jgi:hypothetical protein